MTVSIEPWATRTWSPTDLSVGPAAWRLPVLVRHADHVLPRPSLIVVEQADDLAMMQAAAPVLAIGDVPLLLAMDDPPAARSIPTLIRARLDALQRPVFDAVVIRPEVATDLKGGAALQALFNLKRDGIIRWVGVGHRDARESEWLAVSVAARVVMLDYTLENQSARFRAIAEAAEYGMACLAMEPPSDDGDALRFALAESARVLPVLDRPLPAGLTPMGADEVAARWAQYQATHDPPAPLDRPRPPE